VNVERRRRLWLAASIVLGGTLLAAGTLLPAPFVELSPGPTFNTLGDVDGVPVIQIKVAPTFPTDGHLDLTTVNERGGPDNGVYVGRVLIGWVDPAVRIVPREVYYPDGQSSEEINAQNVQMFSDSESDAIAAALTYLHKPVLTVVVVTSVLTGGPSDTKLHPGDQILSLNGTKVTGLDDVATAMHGVKPGQRVTVTVRGDGGDHDGADNGAGKVHTVAITTEAAPDDPSRAILGITVGTTTRAAFPLKVTLGGVGGPSAGTMLALGIIDKLTPGQLNGGRFVAGTGTITPDGEVGEIGGIEQKMVGARRNGATLFLAPAGNCADVVADGVPSGLTVAKIATLSDAVTQVEDYVAGRHVTPCG
jgi:Lon-like protease